MDAVLIFLHMSAWNPGCEVPGWDELNVSAFYFKRRCRSYPVSLFDIGWGGSGLDMCAFFNWMMINPLDCHCFLLLVWCDLSWCEYCIGFFLGEGSLDGSGYAFFLSILMNCGEIIEFWNCWVVCAGITDLMILCLLPSFFVWCGCVRVSPGILDCSSGRLHLCLVWLCASLWRHCWSFFSFGVCMFDYWGINGLILNIFLISIFYICPPQFTNKPYDAIHKGAHMGSSINVLFKNTSVWFFLS